MGKKEEKFTEENKLMENKHTKGWSPLSGKCLASTLQVCGESACGFPSPFRLFHNHYLDQWTEKNHYSSTIEWGWECIGWREKTKKNNQNQWNGIARRRQMENVI